MKPFERKVCMFTILLITFFTWNCDWKEDTFRRLDQDFSSSLKAGILDKTKIYYFFSDLHKGDGGPTDYFNPNRKVFCSALKDLYENKEDGKEAVVLLVGDIEELWAYGLSLKHGNSYEIKADILLNPRVKEEENIFAWEKMLNEEGRYFRIYGNHDDYWAAKDNVRQSLLGQNNMDVYPAITLRLSEDQDIKIMVTHGCQGQPLHDVNDCIAPLAKEVELVWYYLKRIFLKKGERLRPKVLEKTRDMFNKQEAYLMEWADKNNVILIVGHTHDPYISKESITFILEREIQHLKVDVIKNIDKKINALSAEVKSMDARLDPKIYEKRQRDLKNEEIEKENRELERKFLEKELELRIKRNAMIAPTEPYRINYFNTGCCFASNILTAIKLDYRENNWHAQLESWDVIKEGGIRREDGTIEGGTDKIIKKPIRNPIILRTT